MPFISSSEAKNVYFMSGEPRMNYAFFASRENAYFMSGEPRMKYAFFASRDEINGMFIPKN